MSKFLASEVMRIVWAAIGGAALFSSIALATTVQDYHVGAQLKIQTKTVHSYEQLRKLLTTLEKMVWDKHEICYLRILNTIDKLTTRLGEINARPLTLDPFFTCDAVLLYENLIEVQTARLLREFETKNETPQIEDLKNLMSKINKLVYVVVEKIIFRAEQYTQVNIKYRHTIPTPDQRSK